jgi:hypothetical protein
MSVLLMKNFKLQIQSLENLTASVRFRLRLLTVLFAFSFIIAGVFFNLQNASAQNQTRARTVSTTPFRIGERLTYNISFEKFNNAGFAEIYAVSRGKLGEKDAVELRAKLKTNDLVSAAFYLLDESRTTFASAATGLPLYIRKMFNAGVSPKETIYNYTVTPTINSDLLTLIYKVRNAGGVGNFTFQEDDKIYNISLLNAPNTKSKTENGTIKTDAGEFDTSVSSVESEYLTEKGITNLRVNFSNDEARIPVLVQFKTAKGNFRAVVASVQTIEPEVSAEPSPLPVQTPKMQTTPRPIATPTPYLENEPLLPELSFALGETLEYRVSTGGQLLGLVTLQAKERKQFAGLDSLLLTATVTETQPGQQALVLNDGIRAQVNPDSLAPQQIELKFTGILSSFNVKAKFDQRTGFATYNNANRVEVPMGTHSLLSLVYAVRSFNLKPSKDPNNPVNDTRVAVFLDTHAYVFTLRPSTADLITLQGEKISAQQISITTGNPAIDNLNLRLWLSNDEKRLPLRLIAGAFQADLISEKQISPISEKLIAP